MSVDLLLIHPPVVRPSEPPLGAATLAGFLSDQGLRVEMLDLNVEAFHYLLNPGHGPTAGEEPPPWMEGFVPDQALDRFSRRALKNLPAALRELRSPQILRHPDRYRAMIRVLERVLWLRSARNGGPRVSLTDFRHPQLDPLQRRHLNQMAVSRAGGCLQTFMEERTGQVILETRPRWVGISVNYLSQILPAMALMGGIKAMRSDIRIVVGGSLITAWGERILQGSRVNSWADAWIRGPGELPLARLLGRPLRRALGVHPPRYEGIPWSLYLSPERILPLTATRGCYWGRCRFCPEATGRTGFRVMPPREILGAMEEGMRQNGAEWVHFMDNALPPKVLRGLARSRTGGQWFGFARFEEILMERSFVRELFLSGCRMLQLGLESGSQRLLDAMGKGIDLKKASRILETIHGEGIRTYVYVMFGMPGENLAEAQRTLAFVQGHASWIDHLNCSIMNLPQEADGMEGIERFPFPGAGRDLSLYTDFRSAEGMDRRLARQFLEREFRRHPRVAEILRRDPPAFTSSHAALFLPPRPA